MSEITKTQDTRREFIDVLCELAEKDEKILLLVPDVGFNYSENFASRFSGRFINLGVTEQSAMIIAAGLALAGFKTYLYSMINFVAFRPHEALRNAVCCHNANVKIIGVKGSEKYKFLGFSHNLLHEEEDINICKNMGLKYYLPKSNEEVRKTILETYNTNSPCYIRL